MDQGCWIRQIAVTALVHRLHRRLRVGALGWIGHAVGEAAAVGSCHRFFLICRHFRNETWRNAAKCFSRWFVGFCRRLQFQELWPVVEMTSMLLLINCWDSDVISQILTAFVDFFSRPNRNVAVLKKSRNLCCARSSRTVMNDLALAHIIRTLITMLVPKIDQLRYLKSFYLPRLPKWWWNNDSPFAVAWLITQMNTFWTTDPTNLRNEALIILISTVLWNLSTNKSKRGCWLHVESWASKMYLSILFKR